MKSNNIRHRLALLVFSFSLPLFSCGSTNVNSTSDNSTSDTSSLVSSSSSLTSSESSSSSSIKKNSATSVYFSRNTEYVVKKGSTLTLICTVLPATADYQLTYSSNNEKVATVNEKGVVTGVKSGVAFISVTTDNGLTDTCEVTVNDLSLTSGFDVTYSGTYPTVVTATSLMEASKAISLATLEHYAKIQVKFDFNNTLSVDDFLYNFFELDTEIVYGATDYKKGTGLTNTFTITSNGTDAASAHTTSTSSKTYYDIKFGNQQLRNKTMTHRDSDYDDFYLTKTNNGTMNVSNSEELWYVIQEGYLPTFSTSNTKAEAFYDQAKDILRYIVNDDMTDFEKARAIFDWEVCSTWYDNDALSDKKHSDNSKTCYFLEGVFEYRTAVCDGFSKVFSMLAGIEGLNCVRAYGYDADLSGHAWDYVKLDDTWYLVCPTWGQNDLSKSSSSNIFGQNVGLISYDAFLTKATYFSDTSSYNPTQLIYPDTLSATGYYPNISTLDTISNTSYDYYIDSSEELTAIFEAYVNNNISGNLQVVVQGNSSNVTSSKVKTSLTALGYEFQKVSSKELVTSYSNLHYYTIQIAV